MPEKLKRAPFWQMVSFDFLPPTIGNKTKKFQHGTAMLKTRRHVENKLKKFDFCLGFW